jgi:transposase
MYGVGESIGSQLMAEIGDVRRFSHKQALAAFAGVDPMPNQSGTYEAKSTSSSKRGSPDLRKTLFVLMTILLQKAHLDDPVFQFLDKKRAEGKPYHVYMTAGCNKFLRVYYGRVREYLNTLEPAD